MNVEIAEDETQRLVLEMTQGKRAYGGCCIAYAEGAAVAREVSVDQASSMTTGAPQPPAGPGAGAAASQDDGDLAEGAQAGNIVFQGGAGDLGPYDGSAPSTPDGDGVANDTSWPAVALVVIAGMVGALVHRPASMRRR